MAHVHDKQRIKMGNKTWPMYMIPFYFKLDPSLPIFDHMNSSLFDELILIKD